MADSLDKIIRWLREEGITPRPVSDPKCDFSYAIDRLFGTVITMAIAKPRNGNMVILQTQFIVPSELKEQWKLDYDANLNKLQKELLFFDLSDFKISENSQTIDKINLISYIYPDDVSRQFLFDTLRKLKRAYFFLELYFRT